MDREQEKSGNKKNNVIFKGACLNKHIMAAQKVECEDFDVTDIQHPHFKCKILKVTKDNQKFLNALYPHLNNFFEIEKWVVLKEDWSDGTYVLNTKGSYDYISRNFIVKRTQEKATNNPTLEWRHQPELKEIWKKVDLINTLLSAKGSDSIEYQEEVSLLMDELLNLKPEECNKKENNE